MMMLIMLAVLVAIFILPRFMGGGDAPVPGSLTESGGASQAVVAPTTAPTTAPAAPTTAPAAAQAVVPPAPTPTRAQSAAPAAAATQPGQTWTVMLYQDADDKVLEKDIFVDLNEAERVGSSDRVQIVSQIDRFQAGFEGDGNWTSTRRYHLTQDSDLERIGSQPVEEVGETNMAGGDTVVDFVTWAVANYPADKYVLILSDHGLGWPGGFSDPTARGQPGSNVPLSGALGDQLYLSELDAALEQIRQQIGLDKFELVGLDACLMGHVEVYSALAPHARYVVASQETEPALGWAYASFLGELQANPDMSGADLSRLIVDSYIVEDERILDDQARADLTGRGNALQGLFGIASVPTAAQVAQQLGQNMTLTAADMAALPTLLDSVNALAYALQNVDQGGVAKARTYTQSFTSIFADVPPSYIDLGHFAQLLTQATGSPEIVTAAQNVLAALEQMVMAEKHGPQRAGATGVSVYFPNSDLYRSPLTGPQSYLPVAERFARESLWDDFLAYHYTGRQFDPAPAAVAMPAQADRAAAPGLGAISVGPVEASATSVAVGETVLLRAPISGDNIGYIKLFVGFVDAASNSINVTDMDYLESPETRELNGVYYPDWGEGDFTLEFEWEPIVFAVDNGIETAVALFTPESYGATYQDATYTVDGIYTFGDGGETRYARLYFQDETVRQVFAFTGDVNGLAAETLGAPREVVPVTGDRFTVLEQWMDLDANGRVVEQAREEGETLTFSERTFSWETLDAAAGPYVVGFLVEDLDGNQQAAYTTITVE
jgi:hypothetical protein